MSEDKSDPPGAISDQNREEQPSEMREDGQHPEPRSRDDERSDSSEGGDSSGASGEGSQSTGNPDSAG